MYTYVENKCISQLNTPADHSHFSSNTARTINSDIVSVRYSLIMSQCGATCSHLFVDTMNVKRGGNK